MGSFYSPVVVPALIPNPNGGALPGKAAAEFGGMMNDVGPVREAINLVNKERRISFVINAHVRLDRD